jgi:hypothetical protein
LNYCLHTRSSCCDLFWFTICTKYAILRRTDERAKEPPITGEASLAAEQLPIPLFDGVVLAARTGDGQIHLSLRDLCATIGLDVASQRRRIRANESLHLTAIGVHIDR